MLVKHTALESYPTSTRSESPGEEPEKPLFWKVFLVILRLKANLGKNAHSLPLVLCFLPIGVTGPSPNRNHSHLLVFEPGRQNSPCLRNNHGVNLEWKISTLYFSYLWVRISVPISQDCWTNESMHVNT